MCDRYHLVRIPQHRPAYTIITLTFILQRICIVLARISVTAPHLAQALAFWLAVPFSVRKGSLRLGSTQLDFDKYCSCVRMNTHTPSSIFWKKNRLHFSNNFRIMPFPCTRSKTFFFSYRLIIFASGSIIYVNLSSFI